jgi:lipopolysaccharide export system permease protein
VFYLRKGSADSEFEEVTIVRLTPGFRVEQRIDAQRMKNIYGTRWVLTGIVNRQFTERGATTVELVDRAEYDFNATVSDFRILPGRPEQMRLADLSEQVRARDRVGLPSGQFALALHNRFAYPLAGTPAALLTVGLALRLRRKGHITAALVEGLMIAIALWGMMVVFRTLVMAQHLSPVIAAWAPFSVLTAGSVALWLRHEGKLRWRTAERRFAT